MVKLGGGTDLPYDRLISKVILLDGNDDVTSKDALFKKVWAGGLSASPPELEGKYAMGWARNIWADSVM